MCICVILVTSFAIVSGLFCCFAQMLIELILLFFSSPGEHERAVQLFTASQDLYKQLAARSSEVRHNLTTNYGIGATSLVLAALHACAEGT